MTDVVTSDDLIAHIIEWLGDLEDWPPIPVDEMVRINHAMKIEGSRYYSVQAFLMTLVDTGGSWPPFPPTEIAEQLQDSPRFSRILTKYFISIAATEYRMNRGKA